MVNFIIRDGNKFVLNGNELLQTENPVLEVPDITNSEEVTEKIAEDVQVGDFLYKSRVDFEDNKFSLGVQSYYTLKFAIFRGDLIAFGIHGQNGYIVAWRYKDGEWEDFAPTIKQSYGTVISPPQSAIHQYQDGVIIKDDKLYFTGSRYGGTNNPDMFRINSWDGDILEGHVIQDVSAYPPVRVLDSGANKTFRYGYGTNIYEASGVVHAAVGIEGDDYDALRGTLAHSGVYMYTFDTSTNIYTPVGFSAVETDAVYALDYAEINNELYLFAAQRASVSPLLPHVQNLVVWRWNPSTSYWDYVQSNPAYNIGNMQGIRYRELSDGKYVICGGGSNYGIEIYKFNESTKLLEEYFYEELPGFNNRVFFAVDLFEVSSTKYIVGGLYATQQYDGVSDYSGEYSGATYLGKIVGPTSSLSAVTLDSPLIDAQYMTSGNAASYDYVEQLDTITHEGKVHLILGERWDSVNLYEFDPINERFDRDYRVFVRNFRCRGQNADMTKAEYNGKTFIMYSSTNDSEVKGFVSRNSSVSGGFLPVKWPDIPPANIDPLCNETWVDSDTSTLYTIHGAIRGSNIWFGQYEVSSNQFLKLADPSSISLTANDIRDIRSTELSGIRYFTFAGDQSPYLEVMAFSSGDFHPFNTPSGLTMLSWGSDITTFNDQLFLVASEHNSTITNAIYGWRLDPSGWTEIPIDNQGGFYYNGNDRLMQYVRKIRMLKHEGDLYFCAVQSYAYARAQLWKYNPSTSNWDAEYHIFGGDNQDPYEMDITSFGGYIWLVVASPSNQMGGALCIYRYNPITREKILMRKFEESNSTSVPRWVEMEGELYLSYTGHTINHNPRWYKLSEFANEYTWKKTEDLRNSFGDITQATGVALESGSKGDTIKIRKVKR